VATTIITATTAGIIGTIATTIIIMRRRQPPHRQPRSLSPVTVQSARKKSMGAGALLRPSGGELMPPLGKGYPRAVDLQDRITFDPEQCGGRPCIRGMRIRVKDVLEMLAGGASERQILEDFPDLEPEDLRACLNGANICT